MTHPTPPALETMAGQRLMLGFDGTEMNSTLERVIKDFRAGGIILFRPNIESAPQLERLCKDAQDLARAQGLPPLFIAVDQEGGTVARLRQPDYTEFAGNDHIRTLEEAENFARITAQELKGAGINMNLAPVLDTAHEEAGSIMKKRAFPGDEHRVAELGCRVISTFQESGIMAVAKHFPGIGRTVLDSHFTLPVLDMDLEDIQTTDMVPFKAAMDQGVTGVMLSHIFYPRLDSQWQASLSPAIARDLIRNTLGYQGLTLTDDMDMKAISHDMATCVRQVLKAEIDLTLICHTGPDMETAFKEMVSLLEQDVELHGRALTNHERILGVKADTLGHSEPS